MILHRSGPSLPEERWHALRRARRSDSLFMMLVPGLFLLVLVGARHDGSLSGLGYGMLLLGFIIVAAIIFAFYVHVGTGSLAKAKRGAQAEAATERALMALPDDFHVYCNLVPPGWNRDIDFLVVGTDRIAVIETKSYTPSRLERHVAKAARKAIGLKATLSNLARDQSFPEGPSTPAAVLCIPRPPTKLPTSGPKVHTTLASPENLAIAILALPSNARPDWTSRLVASLEAAPWA